MNLDQAREILTSKESPHLTQALEKLAHEGKPADLQAILTHVASPSPQIKQTAVSAACTIIRENLMNSWNDLPEAVRHKLGTLLHSLSPTVVDELGKDLYSEEEVRRVRAVQVLGLLRDNPRVRDILAKLIQDRNVRVRATAVNLLGRIISFEDRDRELILSLLNDKDKRVRANTIEALEALGNKRVVPILLRFKADPNNRIRGNVLKALHTLGYSGVETELKTMLESNDPYMKASALWVLSQTKLSDNDLHDKAGFYLLSENDMVASNAKRALEMIATPRARGYLTYLGTIVTRSV